MIVLCVVIVVAALNNKPQNKTICLCVCVFRLFLGVLVCNVVVSLLSLFLNITTKTQNKQTPNEQMGTICVIESGRAKKKKRFVLDFIVLMR